MQDEAEPAAFTGSKREPARRREILIARKLGHDYTRRAAFKRFLHGPQGIARATPWQSPPSRRPAAEPQGRSHAKPRRRAG